VATEGLNVQPFGAYTAAATSQARERQLQLVFAWSSSASLVLVRVLALDNAEGTVQELRPGVWRRVAWD